MKKALVVLIMLSVAAGVFATGAQEADEDGIVRLDPRDVARNSVLDDYEKVSVKGTIKFESVVPELSAGGKEYALTAPGANMLASYLTEGQKVTVNGYIVDEDSFYGPRGMGPGMMNFLNPEALNNDITLLVESVEIDGQLYMLPWVEDGFGTMMQGRNFSDDSRFGNMRGGTSSRGGFSRNNSGSYNRPYMNSDFCPVY